MSKWKARWRHAYRKGHRELVVECEAFCLGHFAEHMSESSRAVPVWAWTNLLAHGTEEDLRREEAACAGRSGGAQDWRGARAYLATELLERVERGSSLQDLQIWVLQPLELKLSSQRAVDRWTPWRWVTTVREALCTYEHSRRQWGERREERGGPTFRR